VRRCAITRIFKKAWFERFARKEQLDDSALLEAVLRAEKGLIDADQGGGVISQFLPSASPRVRGQTYRPAIWRF
jgi:hypothetical protein